MTVLLRGIADAQAQISNTITNRTAIAWLMAATLVLAHVVPVALVAGLAKVRWRPIRIDVRIVAPVLATAACVVVWWAHDFDPSAIVVMLAFGLLGYAMVRCGLDRQLLFIAFAFGATLEENIRRALLITRGDALPYLERPISATFLIAGVLIFVVARVWRSRQLAARNASIAAR
jgi:putative tricarboxylic transport membrane protein